MYVIIIIIIIIIIKKFIQSVGATEKQSVKKLIFDYSDKWCLICRAEEV